MKTVINWNLCLIFSLGFAYSQIDYFDPITSIGGYGEMHYNNSKSENEKSTKTIDFHRFVLFFSHSWTEEWSFKSELELEHNLVQEGQGELELEQAYVNYYNDGFGFQAGVILPSVGILNENHEPVLFLSVERPDYAKYILPTTWFGNGAAAYGKFLSFDIKAVVMEGLNGDKIIDKWNQGIRGGRQKGYKANAENPVYNFAVNYTGFKNIKLGGSFTSTEAVVSQEQNNIPLQLAEFHFSFNKGNLLAVFEAGKINFTDHSVKSSSGYYLDFGYNVARIFKLNGNLIPWIRWTGLNPAQGNPEQKNEEYNKRMAGLTYKPIPNVVFKIDYGIQAWAEDSKTSKKTLNLGVGYHF